MNIKDLPKIQKEIIQLRKEIEQLNDPAGVFADTHLENSLKETSLKARIETLISQELFLSSSKQVNLSLVIGIGSIIVGLIAIFISFQISRSTLSQNQKLNDSVLSQNQIIYKNESRPYLVTDSTINAGFLAGNPTTMKSILGENLDGARVRFLIGAASDKAASTTIATISFNLKNVGKSPAAYHLASITYQAGVSDFFTITPNKGNVASYGIIQPDQTENIYYTSQGQEETNLLQEMGDFSLSGSHILIKIEYEPAGQEKNAPSEKYYIQIEGVLSCEDRMDCVASTWHIKDAN